MNPSPPCHTDTRLGSAQRCEQDTELQQSALPRHTCLRTTLLLTFRKVTLITLEVITLTLPVSPTSGTAHTNLLWGRVMLQPTDAPTPASFQRELYKPAKHCSSPTGSLVLTEMETETVYTGESVGFMLQSNCPHSKMLPKMNIPSCSLSPRGSACILFCYVIRHAPKLSQKSWMS